MKEITRLFVATTSCLLVIFTWSAAAGNPAAWQKDLQDIDRLIIAGEYKKAEKRCKRLSAEVVDRVEGGPGVSKLLATVASFRALALAGLEQVDLAAWYCDVAHILSPETAELAMDKHRELGAQLNERKRLRSSPQLVDLTSSTSHPMRISGPNPAFPIAARQMNIQEGFAIDIVVDTEGTPREPKLLQGPDYPTLAYSALESLGGWRFQPAVIDGEEVASNFVLTIKFSVRGR